MIAVAILDLAQAIGRYLAEPIRHVRIGTDGLDQPRKGIAAGAVALGARHAEHVELADKIGWGLGSRREPCGHRDRLEAAAQGPTPKGMGGRNALSFGRCNHLWFDGGRPR